MAELLLLILDIVKNKPDPQFRFVLFFLIYLPFVPYGDITEA